MSKEPRKPFSEVLLDAADDIDNLSRSQLQVLLRRASIRIRKIEEERLMDMDWPANDPDVGPLK